MRSRMVARLDKIVIVNTADQGGGAERVSMTVLDGFLERGLDAWLLVGRKTSEHPRVVSFYTSSLFDYRPYQAGTALGEAARRRTVDEALGLEDFNHPYSHHIGELTGSPPDLVLCHNLHGGFFDLRVLPELSAHLPVAVRLFDTWLLAGHCAYSLGCDRWRAGCGECPDLTIPPAIARDATRTNLLRKQEIFRSSRLFLSAESRWMLERARSSVLAPAAVTWTHVPGGVDLDTFLPGSRGQARRELGLDPQDFVLLYVANGGSANRYKDFATVRRALGQLGEQAPKRRLTLLVVGSDAADEHISSGVLIRHVGYVESRRRLAAFYRAANVLVHAAVEETFGNVVAEAMACGTPVVAASGGGVTELIEHGHSGLLLAPGRPERLADAVAHLLHEPARARALGVAAAAAARRNLDSRAMVRSLHRWCSEIHSAWHARLAA